MYYLASISFNYRQQQLSKKKQMIQLDKQTSELLRILIEQDGPVEKEKLLEQIWQGKVVSDAAITSAIRRLRKAFEQLEPDLQFIKTINKLGYCLAIPATNTRRDQIHFKLIMLIFLALLIFISSALSFFNVERKQQNKIPSAHYLQAIHIWELKDPHRLGRAIELLQQGLVAKPDSILFHNTLAQIYSYKMSRTLGLSDQHILKKARFHMAAATKISPQHPETALAAAMLNFYYLHDLDKAKTHLALAKKACSAMCYFFQANLFTVLADLDQAIKMAEQAFKLSPDTQIYIWELVWVKFMASDYVQALHHLENAEAFSGKRAYLVRAVIAQAQGENVLALLNWAYYFRQQSQLSSEQLAIFERELERSQPLVSLLAKQLLSVLVLQTLPRDQIAMLQLLAQQNQKAVDTIVATTGLQRQSYLLWVPGNPIFKRELSPVQLKEIRDFIWHVDD